MSATTARSDVTWTIDSQWSVGAVDVILQLYNYTAGEYPGTGDGFIQYTSGAANTDELRTQTILGNPNDYRDGAGNWQVRILGDFVGVNFTLHVDWVEFKHTAYQLDVEFTTNTVTIAEYYWLEINYQANGETFDVLVYNGATWDDLGDLSSGAMTALVIPLNSNHRLGSGDVRVRYIGQSETGDNSQSTLYTEYHRIRSYRDGPNLTADVTLTGQAYSKFGFSVANASDVDNDNYDDVLVGAPGYDNNRGSAHIYMGDNPMDSTVDVTFTGAQLGDQFGYSVASVGDFDSDGYPDVIIGAPYNDSATGSRSNSGAVYIFLGASGIGGIITANNANFTAYGENANDRFGWSVDLCGNVNLDRFKDVLIGAPFFGDDAGKAYIIYQVPEFPMLLLPMIIVIILFISRRKLYHSTKKKIGNNNV